MVNRNLLSILDNLRGNTTLKWMGIPFIGFWAAAFFIPSEILIQGLNCVLIALAAGVAATYWPTVYQGIKTGQMPRYTHLAIGIFFGWIAMDMTRVWAGLIRIYDLDWMRDSRFVAFYIFTSIMAGVFHISAPGAINGTIPTKNWIHIGIAVMVGVLIGIIATFLVTGFNIAAQNDVGLGFTFG